MECPTPVKQDFWFPLKQFYQRRSLAWVEPQPLAPDAVPEPYHQLLVHQKDMTPTLSAHYGDDILITVYHQQRVGYHYSREVVLKLKHSQRKIEWGGIQICLNALPEPTQRLITKAQLPLGFILNDQKVQHRSRPLGFFRMRPDAHIQKVLGASDAPWLYGRRNQLLLADERVIAEIVEILPSC